MDKSDWIRLVGMDLALMGLTYLMGSVKLRKAFFIFISDLGRGKLGYVAKYSKCVIDVSKCKPKWIT